MACRTESHHGYGHHGGSFQCGCHRHGCSCGCGGHFRFGACFMSQEEKVAQLEQYLEGLQEEAKAVEERIAALRGG